MMSLDAQITDAQLKAHAAKTLGCKMFHAREAVRLCFARGDFPAIQDLDDLTLEYLALALVKDKP